MISPPIAWIMFYTMIINLITQKLLLIIWFQGFPCIFSYMLSRIHEMQYEFLILIQLKLFYLTMHVFIPMSCFLCWLHVNSCFYSSFHYKSWLWIDKFFKQAYEKGDLRPNDTPNGGTIRKWWKVYTFIWITWNELFYEQVIWIILVMNKLY